MKKLLILLLLLSSCGGYRDFTKGSVDTEVQSYVDQIKQYAIDYNAGLFNERMQYIDVVWSDSPKGIELLNNNVMTEVALTYPVDGQRIIVLNRDVFTNQTETQKLIVLIHEYYHAVSEIPNAGQHNDAIIYNSEGYIMPLSIMHSSPAMVADYWEEYQDFYLRTLFGLRLDRTWKE
jgi:hypothetical protein